MNNLVTSHIALRSQEYYEGLRRYNAFGPKEMYLRRTLSTGKSAVLSSHIKGLDYIDDPEPLMFLAAELGINSTELESVLRTLEGVDFIKIVGSPEDFKRIDVRVPELRDSYAELGEYWRQKQPSEIEQAAITILDEVAAFPREKHLVIEALGLDEKTVNTVLDLASMGALVKTHLSSDDSEILYSPLFIEENPEVAIKFTRKFSSEKVTAAVSEILNHQGVPIEKASASVTNALAEGVQSGFFAPVNINSGGVAHTFIFLPRGGLTKEEYVILDKARAIIACIRCGQYFAKVAKIQHPVALLTYLRLLILEIIEPLDTPGLTFKSNTDCLLKKQVAQIVPDTSRPSFYHLHILDTPENMRAINVALDMLLGNQAPSSHLSVDAGTFFSVTGTYSGAISTRATMAESPSLTRRQEADIIMKISKIASGVIIT